MVSEHVSPALDAVGTALRNMKQLDTHLRKHCTTVFEDDPNAYATVQDDATGLASEVCPF